MEPGRLSARRRRQPAGGEELCGAPPIRRGLHRQGLNGEFSVSERWALSPPR